jgi:hypothetical protein
MTVGRPRRVIRQAVDGLAAQSPQMSGGRPSRVIRQAVDALAARKALR